MLRGTAVRGWPWLADRRAGGWKVPAHPKLDLATDERELSVPEGRWARSVPAVAEPPSATGRWLAATALTLTLGEPAHSLCRAGPARRRGSQRERNQHRRVRTTVPPFAEGTAPLRRARGAGARARRPGKRLSLLRHGPAGGGTPCRDAAPVAVAARGDQGVARVRSGRRGDAHRRALA